MLIFIGLYGGTRCQINILRNLKHINLYRLIEKEKDNEEQVLKRSRTRTFREEGDDVGEGEEGGNGRGRNPWLGGRSRRWQSS